MQITNPGEKPSPPNLDLSPLRYDFSREQPWVAGVEIACERCHFAATLGDADTIENGVHAAYHFHYKDGSRNGWGSGIYVCPTCGTYLFFEKELTSSPGPIGEGDRGSK